MRQSFPRVLDERTLGRERMAPQGRGIVERLHNRTLEVRGSIPLGSTRKRSRRVELRGDFVFGRPANRSLDLEVTSDPVRLPT